MHLRDMKQFIFSTLAIVSLFAFISCERHSWEDSAEGAKDGTKHLFPKEEKKSDDAEHGHDH
jgi:hypothetical protein